MEKMSLKAYAVKHKLSLFNVVKMAKSGQVPTETVQEDGKDKVYILIDEEVEKKVTLTIVSAEGNAPYNLRKENERIKKENEGLKKEIEKLKKEIIALKKRV
jgi:gas vesicle protein